MLLTKHIEKVSGADCIGSLYLRTQKGDRLAKRAGLVAASLRALLAYYGIDRLRFVLLVYTGDTVRVRAWFLGKSAKDEARGVVNFEKAVLNQHDQTVIAYVDKMLFRRSP